MSYLAEDFGKKLRQARRDRKLTQVDAAAKAGITRTTLMRLEKGANVGIDDACRLAFALGYTLALAETVRPTWENAAQFFGAGESEDD